MAHCSVYFSLLFGKEVCPWNTNMKTSSRYTIKQIHKLLCHNDTNQQRKVMLIYFWINPVVCWYCLSMLVLSIVYEFMYICCGMTCLLGSYMCEGDVHINLLHPPIYLVVHLSGFSYISFAFGIYINHISDHMPNSQGQAHRPPYE